MPAFGSQLLPECSKAPRRQGDIESPDHQTVLLGGREHSRIITDDPGVSVAASQPLHHLPDWVSSSIRVEAVDHSVRIGRDSGVSRKEEGDQGRVAPGITPWRSRRTVLARLRHTARPVTGSFAAVLSVSVTGTEVRGTEPSLWCPPTAPRRGTPFPPQGPRGPRSPSSPVL